MKLINIPAHNADCIKDGQLITLQVEHYGEVRDVEFRAWVRAEGDEAVLTSTSDVAYCRVSGGKTWPCDLRVSAMTTQGRNRDVAFPARESIPTWSMWTATNRLNRSYPISGWWDKNCENNRSQHNSA